MMFNKQYKKLMISLVGFITLTFVIHIFNSSSPTKSPDLSLFQAQQLQTPGFLPTNKKAVQIISDFTVLKCNIYSKCNVPKGYIQLFPSLNYYHNSKIKTDYYLIIKLLSIDQTTKIITDVTTTNKNDNDNSDSSSSSYEEIIIEPGKLSLYKKTQMVNVDQPIDDKLPILRSIDVLFGNNDLIDSRPHHKSLHLSNSESMHTILSLNMMTLIDQNDLQEIHQQTINLRNSQLIETMNKKYKIMQLSDLHFGQDLGRCDDTNTSSGGGGDGDGDGDGDEHVDEFKCSSDLKTLKFIEKSIQEENPDLIVITGDLIDIHRSIDYKSILLKSLQPILAHKIKFIYTFGDEIKDQLTKISIIQFLSTLPNCLNTVPQEVIEDNNNNNNNKMHGITNYNFQIKQKSSTPSSSSSISVTVLDSEDHLIDDSQMTYLYRINNELLNDYKLLFFHYPLPQFRPKGKFKIVGSYNEKHELDRKTKLKFHDDIISCGYNVISVGHEHENDACLLSSSSSSSSSSSNSDKSIWLCYNSITGDSGITKLDKQYVRKLRLFEIDFEKNRILSWKRKEIDNQPFDYQLIYEKPQKKEKEK